MAESAFTWGPGGEAETSSRRSRRIAEALAAQGMSGAPIQSVTQGINRVAQALVGNYMLAQEDARDRQLQQEADRPISNEPAFAGAGDVASAPARPYGRIAAALAGDRVYRNDEPSPLDPPSGADRDALVRTVIAEAGNQGPVGMNAVASVVKNRAALGGYGGDTIPGVVQAPGQFEPF